MTRETHRDDAVWTQALDWLTRVHDAPEDIERRRALDAWLAEDDAHLRAYRKAERVWSLTGLMAPTCPLAPPSPAGVAPAVARLRGGSGRWRIAAALAACLGILTLTDLLPRPGIDYSTGTAETRRVGLADGSLVVLDSASAIGVAVGADRRAVSLVAGRAFFQVIPDRTRPFEVSAGKARVTVTGTAFDVRLGEATVDVAVASGSVAVSVAGDAGTALVRLGPGERARVSRADGSLRVESKVDPRQVGAWRDGRLVVTDTTVGEVVDELRRHSHALILLSDRTIAARRVTGVFTLADPAAALDAVVQPHGHAVHHLTPYLLVVSPR